MLAEQRHAQAEILAKLLPVVRDVRRIGSCALDLCMVAAGHLDAYYEDGVHVWDWAAGALIAAEAGATLRLPAVRGPPGTPGSSWRQRPRSLPHWVTPWADPEPSSC